MVGAVYGARYSLYSRTLLFLLLYVFILRNVLYSNHSIVVFYCSVFLAGMIFFFLFLLYNYLHTNNCLL